MFWGNSKRFFKPPCYPLRKISAFIIWIFATLQPSRSTIWPYNKIKALSLHKTALLPMYYPLYVDPAFIIYCNSFIFHCCWLGPSLALCVVYLRMQTCTSHRNKYTWRTLANNNIIYCQAQLSSNSTKLDWVRPYFQFLYICLYWHGRQSIWKQLPHLA